VYFYITTLQIIERIAMLLVLRISDFSLQTVDLGGSDTASNDGIDDVRL
jgi:hypothetical protein